MKLISFKSRVALIAIVWLVAGAPLVNAQDAVKVSEADVKTYLAIRYANAVASEKRLFARGDAKKIAAIDAQKSKALADAHWTQERYEQVRDAVEQSATAMNEAQGSDADAAKSAKETLAQMDQGTVQAVRKLRDAIAASDQEKASAEARESAAAERRGTPPDAKSLLGTWVFDLELTVDAAAEETGISAKDQLRAALSKLPKTTFVFGPGAEIRTTTEDKPGVQRTEKGTYRLENGKILVRAEGSRRERAMDAGMKNGNLHIGMMGVSGVYRRQP